MFIAEREVGEPTPPTYLSSIFYFYFRSNGVRLGAHLEMHLLSCHCRHKTQVQSYSFFFYIKEF
jgi:hypothetical protein